MTQTSTVQANSTQAPATLATGTSTTGTSATGTPVNSIQTTNVSASAANARLVMNHSTHIPGLIKVLEKLAQNDAIQTITPGVICAVRAHVPQLRLRVSVPIRGGFKIIARSGKIAQEVFILTTLQQAELEGSIARILGVAK